MNAFFYRNKIRAGVCLLLAALLLFCACRRGPVTEETTAAPEATTEAPLPEGSITVRVGRGDTMASISVADTGIGLTPEECKMVFSRFWRGEAGRNRAQGGLGIGLSVVKEIVDRHNGWVRVEGEKGVGATFTIFIPLYDESRANGKDRGKSNRKERD